MSSAEFLRDKWREHREVFMLAPSIALGVIVAFLSVLVKNLFFDGTSFFDFIAALFAFFLCIFFLNYFKSKFLNEKFNRQKFISNCALQTIGAMVYAALFVFVIHLLDCIIGTRESFLNRAFITQVKQFSFTCVLSVFLAAVVEEVLFRQYIYKITHRFTKNFIFAVILNSVLFAFFHSNNYNKYVIVYIFLMGVTFTLLYWLTKKLSVPIGLHCANNLMVEQSQVSNLYAPSSFFQLFEDQIVMSLLFVLVSFAAITSRIKFTQRKSRA